LSGDASCYQESSPEIILDDGKLDDAGSDYLLALRDGFLPIHQGAPFHVEPYSSHCSVGNLDFVSDARGAFGGSSLLSNII